MADDEEVSVLEHGGCVADDEHVSVSEHGGCVADDEHVSVLEHGGCVVGHSPSHRCVPEEGDALQNLSPLLSKIYKYFFVGDGTCTVL